MKKQEFRAEVIDKLNQIICKKDDRGRPWDKNNYMCDPYYKMTTAMTKFFSELSDCVSTMQKEDSKRLDFQGDLNLKIIQEKMNRFNNKIRNEYPGMII